MGGNDQGMDIAVIGLSGRFPGARDVDEFWRNLRDGVESLTFFADEDLDEAIDPELIRHPDYVKAAPTLDDIDLFDADFFGYSAREAAILDPAQRMFLECAWEALESAGHTAAGFGGSIGVYVGAGSNSTTYFTSNLLRSGAVDFATEGFDLVIANDKDYLGTRVSYKLDLTGPAVSVQTACSTSLVAVHLAVQSLFTFECDMALAGGSSVRVPQRSGHLYREGMFESADGHSRPFDARASGLTFGSGMGVVVLKRLEDALADGDPVQAVIKGSAISNDGAHKISYVAPSVDGQARAIADALARSGVDPDTVTAIEAHGTSTPVGDPIEVAALTRVYGGAGRPGPRALGSVKSNVGHLDGAAGIAGLIKAVLQARHGELVPTLNHAEPNPEIDFAGSSFAVNTELRQWHPDGIPRRIGVSAFGVGGTNAHVIVEEPPAPRPTTPGRPVQLLPISAATPEALDEAAATLASALRTADSADLADVAYTLQVGRAPLRHRRVLVAREPAEAAGALAEPPAREHTGTAPAIPPKIGFLFTGLGSQYPNMGRDLYEAEPDFAEHLDACARLLTPEVGVDVRQAIFSEGDRLRDTAVAQPALFAVEYALARLWQGWGVQPDAMIGHSMGEITAATVAGVFTLEDAARLIAVRGALMGRTEPGAMLSVPLPEQRVRELLPAGLSLAAVNAPDLCVVSGPREPLTRFRHELEGRDVPGRPLRVDRAFHSDLMDPILEPLRAELARLSPRPPRIPFVSNRTAGWIDAEAATDPAYWRDHVRDTVRFGDGVRLLFNDFGDVPTVLLEIGPGRTLASLARMAGGAGHATVLSSLPRPDDETPAAEFLMLAAGRLWLAGVELDWAKLHTGERRRRRRLPTYPFQRRRYWIEPEGAPHARRARTPDAPAPAVQAPRPELPSGYVAPRGDWERRVAAIWQELLGVEAIGVDDRFYDLGAESLTFMRVRERIKDEHGVSVPMRPLLTTRTVAELAELAAEVASKGPATSTLDLLRGLAGERAGLPPNELTADTRPVADLHLGPDAVREILDEAAGALERPGPRATADLLGASLGELTALLDDVRPYRVEHVPADRPAPPPGSGPAGTWSVHAPAGHPLAEPLRAALASAGIGDGVLLCLPESGEDHVGLILAAGRQARSAPDGSRFVVVQRDFGAAGLARTLHLERPSAPTTVVELAEANPAAVASVVAEAAATTGYSQVRYAADGTRTVPVLRPLADPAGPPGDPPLDERDVLLATGGARGITAECALAMARDFGVRLALLGRADPEHDRELASTVDRMTAAGVRLRYERADVTSAEAVRQAVHRFESGLGPITGVLHGAGNNEPRELTGLTEEQFRAALAPKTVGLRTVLDAVGADRLTLLLTFGSIIGRAGLRGEAHYATANDWLTELTVHYGARNPRMRALALEWSVWSGAGMGERLGVVEGPAWEGITPIGTGAGIAVLRQVLADPSAGPALVVTGPVAGLPTLNFA